MLTSWIRTRFPIPVLSLLLLAACGGSGDEGEEGGDEQPRLSIHTPSSSLWVRRGDSAVLRVEVSGGAEDNQMVVIRATGLPEGVSSGDVVLERGASEAAIAFMASADAPVGGAHSISIDAVSDGEVASTSIDLTVAGMPGELDSTFGDGGMVTVPMLLPGSSVRAQFGVGTTGLYMMTWEGPDNQFALRRVTPDGVVDANFGESGVVQRRAEASGNCRFAYSHLNDRIFTACLGGAGSEESERGDFVVRCVEATGQAGSGCASWGPYVLHGEGWSLSKPPFIAVDTVGRVLLAASVEEAASGEPVLQQYRIVPDDGWSLDPSFGDNGIVGMPGVAGLARLLPSDDGGILVVGTDGTYGQSLIVKFSGDGSLDQTFGADGALALDFAIADAVTTHDSIYALADDSLIVSLGQNGATRVSFANEGLFVLGDASMTSLAAAKGGGVYAAVTSHSAGSVSEGYVQKVSAEGDTDDAFRQRIQGKYPELDRRSALWVGMQPDGRLLAVFNAPHRESDPTFLVARFWP